jgi:methionyl-tRNA formyltransferase
VETATTPPRGRFEKLKRSIKYDGWTATARKFVSKPAQPNGTLDLTREAAFRCGTAYAEVENYHSGDSIRLLASADADLGVVYGTNIIKESVFSIPRLGSINLHQGLAPHYRGGPPVFWELFNGESEVGLTAHFVAAKVDTGDIVLQRKVPLEYDPAFGLDLDAFIADYRERTLREASARLVAEAVAAIASGDFVRTPQDTTLGKRYRLPTKKEKDELRRRLRARIARGGR